VSLVALDYVMQMNSLEIIPNSHMVEIIGDYLFLQELNKGLLFRTITTLLVRHKHINNEKTEVTSDIVLSCFDVVCQVCSNNETIPLLDALQHSHGKNHRLLVC
jgi:hypothetical protein